MGLLEKYLREKKKRNENFPELPILLIYNVFTEQIIPLRETVRGRKNSVGE